MLYILWFCMNLQEQGINIVIHGKPEVCSSGFSRQSRKPATWRIQRKLYFIQDVQALYVYKRGI